MSFGYRCCSTALHFCPFQNYSKCYAVQHFLVDTLLGTFPFSLQGKSLSVSELLLGFFHYESQWWGTSRYKSKCTAPWKTEPWKGEVKQQIRGTLSTITPMKSNYTTKAASTMLIHRFNNNKKNMHTYKDILVRSTTLKFNPSPHIKLNLWQWTSISPSWLKPSIHYFYSIHSNI